MHTIFTAKLSQSLKVSDRRQNMPKSAQNGSESFCAGLSVITVQDIWGLVKPSFRPKSGSKSKISGRILKSVRGPFGSAESCSDGSVRFPCSWSLSGAALDYRVLSGMAAGLVHVRVCVGGSYGKGCDTETS
jgi:hypothetical protein